eukprot:TRINITY_DN10509_c0_g1_i5.p1 TRINITY_DN10509_c0_g1~~TRINITY_DN10509_c0_g1_i5.p1  ORF type:complete len:891 (+),score=242.99 TRINITY_DN10509_c0_g1_i5:50-2722(+)
MSGAGRLLHGVAFIAILANACATEITTRNGNILLTVNNIDTNKVYVASAATVSGGNAENANNQLLTMGAVTTMMDALRTEMQAKIDVLTQAKEQAEARIQVLENAALNTSAVEAVVNGMVKSNTTNDLGLALTSQRTLLNEQATKAEDFETRIKDLEDNDNLQDASLTRLDNDKADEDDVRTDTEIRNVVELMVVGTDNALKSALASKVDVSAQYDNDDARSLLNTIVNSGTGDPNALRSVLDDLKTRVTAVESIANHDCGGTCAPGKFVSQQCDATANPPKPTSCQDCADGKYSSGGLVAACLDCDACQAGFHEVAGCTATSNRLCAKCRQCVPGATYETLACTAQQDRTCSPCDTCQDGFYIDQECTLTANTECKQCSPACGTGLYQSAPCTATADRVCTTCSTCPSGTYQTQDCTATSDTVCTPCSTCADTEEAVVPCSNTQDTVCLKRGEGFNSDSLASQNFTKPFQWTLLPGFDTTGDAYQSTFVREGTNFNGSIFTPATDGYYFMSFNIRLDRMSTNWFHCNLGRNGVIDTVANGLNAMRGQSNYQQWTFASAAVVSAKANDAYGVYVQAASDRDFEFHEDSSFSAYKLEPTEGVFSYLDVSQAQFSTGWVRVSSGWSTGAPHGFLLNGKWDSGEYTVKESGIFIIGYTIRYNNINNRPNNGVSFVRTLVTVNGRTDVHNSMQNIESGPFSAFFSTHVNGVQLLRAGDRLQPAVFSSWDGNYQLYRQGHFSAVRIETSTAFAADMTGTLKVRSDKPFVVTGWRTSGNLLGLVDRGNHFNEQSGVFVAPQTGFYYASANIRIDALSTATQILVAIVSSADDTVTDAGLSVVQTKYGTMWPPYQQLNPAGVMFLRKGDQATVQVQVLGEVEYNIQEESGFGMVLLP